MGHKVRGVVAHGKGAPVTVETVQVPDPGPGEALVAVQACGGCYTDLHYRQGRINDEFPFLLGHEAAGVVEAVGDGVDTVAPGDFVILNWRAGCGRCRACRRGKPWYCFDTVNARETDVVEAVRAATGGFGADVVIDAVGRPETWKQAFFARDLAGTVVLVGVPSPDMMVPDIPLLEIFGRGGALKSSWYGDCLPERDFPMLVELHLQGRLPLDKFVSETISLDDVERAFEKIERGEVLRSVVLLGGSTASGAGQ